MLFQPQNYFFYFFSNIILELFISWKHCVCKHKVLPYQYSFFITKSIKVITLIITTSPNSNHIIVGIYCVLNNLFIILLLYSRHKHIRGYIVTTFHKNVNLVKSKFECASVFILFLNKFYSPQSNRLMSCIYEFLTFYNIN